MYSKALLAVGSVIFAAAMTIAVSAQTYRKSVSAAEVNGTYEYKFTGRYKGSSNMIKVLALGGRKLRVSINVVYPYYVNGDLMANIGQLETTAVIDGDTATISDREMPKCRATLFFASPGVLKVSGADETACGFGHNVTGNGTYKKTSSAKPTFDSAD